MRSGSGHGRLRQWRNPESVPRGALPAVQEVPFRETKARQMLSRDGSCPRGSRSTLHDT
jgi:hypothetical protein